MDTCFGLYGTTLDVRISCLAFDLSRVLLGISLLTLDLMRVGLGKKKKLNDKRYVWNGMDLYGFLCIIVWNLYEICIDLFVWIFFL